MLWWYSQQVHAECSHGHVSACWPHNPCVEPTSNSPRSLTVTHLDSRLGCCRKEASNVPTSQSEVKRSRRLTAFGDQDLAVNSGIVRVARMPASAELSTSQGNLIAKSTCQDPSSQTERSVVCLTTCLEPHDGLARGTRCSLPSFDNGKRGFHVDISQVARSTRIAASH